MSLNLLISHYKLLQMKKSAIIWNRCTIVSHPVLTKTTVFLLLLKSVSPIIIVYSMLSGLAVILHLKYDKNVYIIITLFIFVSKKSLNFK